MWCKYLLYNNPECEPGSSPPCLSRGQGDMETWKYEPTLEPGPEQAWASGARAGAGVGLDEDSVTGVR